MRRTLSRILALSSLALLLLTSVHSLPRQQKNTAERLGYPADSKLLIIHADDVGLCHSVNRATFTALESKTVTCGSIMVPCPWFGEVADYCKKHPDADLGLHLTLNSEWKHYRWGPQASRRDVVGLLDPDGFLWADVPPVIKNATSGEVETELRAQIDRALKSGIHPTHLDAHMAAAFAPTFIPVYIGLAREYQMPFFGVRMLMMQPALQQLLKETDLIPDNVAMANEGVQADKWQEYYEGLLKSLKPGLTELIVHLGYDDAELRAITEDHPAFGSAWRQRDFDVLSSPGFRKALQDNHVILVGWREIKKLGA